MHTKIALLEANNGTNYGGIEDEIYARLYERESKRQWAFKLIRTKASELSCPYIRLALK